jgi:hypothetical protein
MRKATERKNPKAEIKIDLELRPSVLDKELNVNSLVSVLKENMSNRLLRCWKLCCLALKNVRFQICRKGGQAVRYVCNGHERDSRQFRASSGLYR